MSDFDAFVAGFEASGEGYNGEYVHPRYRGEEAFMAEMRRLFEVSVGRPLDREGRLLPRAKLSTMTVADYAEAKNRRP